MNPGFKIGFFIGATIINLWFSKTSILKPESHGFYRFFVFEIIVIIVLINIDYWFKNAFNWQQIISWIFLLTSIFLAVQGFLLLHKSGRKDIERTDTALKDFEKTSNLIKTGAYRYIRHPLYSSLLFLGWGAFLKNITLTTFILVILLSLFLFLTARREEYENLAYFGDDYRKYMKQTRMFIPFLY